MITIDQFGEVELRVGNIVSAGEVEGSDKLLLLHIDIGEEQPRVILSGIRKYYTPESLEGKRCIVVANLQPRSMMGYESKGMLVCASYEDEVEIIEPSGSIPVGSLLS